MIMWNNELWLSVWFMSCYLPFLVCLSNTTRGQGVLIGFGLKTVTCPLWPLFFLWNFKNPLQKLYWPRYANSAIFIVVWHHVKFDLCFFTHSHIPATLKSKHKWENSLWEVNDWDLGFCLCCRSVHSTASEALNRFCATFDILVKPVGSSSE